MLFCILALAGGRLSAAPRFVAALDRSTIALGESAVLTVTFEDCDAVSGPEIPAVANLRIGGGQSEQQITILNGQQSIVKREYYELQPTKEGDYVIGPIKAELNTGKQAQAAPLTLKVVKNAPGRPTGAPEAAMVKLVPPRQQMYLGETLPVDIYAFCQQAGEIQRPRLDASGFNTGTVSDWDKPVQQVQYGGQVYNRLIFHAPITPVRTGTLTLGPASWALTLLLGPRDIWGNFSQYRKANVVSDPVQIQVLPLPTNDVPANFSGAIGSFSIASYEAGPTNVAVGDPITIKVKISGTGNFNLVALTQNPQEWQDFKLYPSTSKFEPSDALETSGTKYFEQVVLPQNTSIKELPPFSFSFFDPVAKKYKTLTAPATPIIVRPTVATPQPTVFSSAPQPTDAPPPAREIVHIKAVIGKVGRAEPSYILRPGFWALEALAPLMWIGSVIWRKRRENLANNPRLVRQREVAKLLKQGLKDLAAMAHANRTDDFYAQVFRLLQEVLGERLDLPASAITEAVLDDVRADAALQTAARELFQVCNQYRYAPVRSGEELASLLPKIENTLTGLHGIEVKCVSRSAAAVASVLAIAFLACSVNAQVPQTAVTGTDITTEFTSANRLYEQGKFADAARAYDRLIRSGWSSPALFFNLGNAWFKAGQFGRAILAYRKAQTLAPRDPDIRANLQFARTELGNAHSQLPGNRWMRMLNWLTLNEWAVLTGLVTASLFILLTVVQIAPGKKGLRSWIIALAILSCGSIGCLAAAASQQLNDPIAVVISADTVIRRGPFAESPSIITARDGTELLVIDSNNEWAEVTDAAKHTGWVPKTDLGWVK